MPGSGIHRRVAPMLVAAALVFAFTAVTRPAHAKADAETSPKISPNPLSAERLAIYRVILYRWMGGGPGNMVLNLAGKTRLLENSDEEGCGKNLDMESDLRGEIHRFRPEDLAQLGSPKSIVLVDSQRQQKDIARNDPWKKIQQGNSVDSAVRNGYAHGLFTFSEIRFDKSHTHAIVAYGFRCGSLCGNGATLVMEKAGNTWKIQSQCTIWMSRLSPLNLSVPDQTPQTGE